MTAPRVGSRPAGSSLLTQVGSAGAALARGAMNEKERQRQIALQAAVREFDENMKKEALALDKDQFGLQKTSTMAGIAHNDAMRAMAQQEALNRKDEFQQTHQLNKDQLQQQATLAREARDASWKQHFATIRANERIAGLNWQRDNLVRLETDLSRRADDTARDIRALAADPEFRLTYLMDPTGRQAQLNIDLQSKDPATLAKAQAMQTKINEWQALKKDQMGIKQDQQIYENYRKTQSPELLQALGAFRGGNQNPNHWDNLTPESQANAAQRTAKYIVDYMAVNNGQEPLDDLGKAITERGYPEQVIAQARQMAGTLANTPEQEAIARTGPTANERAIQANAGGGPAPKFVIPENAPIKQLGGALRSMGPSKPLYGSSPNAPMPPMGQLPSLPGNLPANPLLSPTAPGGTLPRAGKDSVMSNKMPKHRL